MGPDFWRQSPKVVAQQLLGRSFLYGETEATILKAVGYLRSENEKDGLYKPVLEMSSGEIYLPRRRNSILFLIVTADGPVSGGCVLIRAAEIGRVIYDGPGKLTERLGLSEHGVSGTTEWVNDDTFAVIVGAVRVPRKSVVRVGSRVQNEGNGIGRETLQRLMPKIVAKYLSDKAETTFHDFLNSLLQTCGNVNQLRALLRGK